jgi:predicted DNA-binding protein (MmcQ/YjbR family)
VHEPKRNRAPRNPDLHFGLATCENRRVMTPTTIPLDVVRLVRQACASLPEATDEEARGRVVFRIRQRVFLNLLAVDDPAGNRVSIVSLKVEPSELAALIANGHPYFRLGSSRAAGWVGVVIDQGTDWSELQELATDSYCFAAPKRLADLIKRNSLASEEEIGKARRQGWETDAERIGAEPLDTESHAWLSFGNNHDTEFRE